MRYVVIGVLLAFGLGSCVGNSTDPAPKVDFVKITRTKTVTASPQPQPAPEPIMPESCKDALRYAAAASTLAEKMYGTGRTQLTIISMGREYLAANQNTAPVEVRQRNLQANTVGYLAKLSEALYFYDTSKKKCAEETE